MKRGRKEEMKAARIGCTGCLLDTRVHGDVHVRLLSRATSGSMVLEKPELISMTSASAKGHVVSQGLMTHLG